MTNDNPILNNPYSEPELHYATNPEGELDYENVVKGRRLFTGTAQAIPVRKKSSAAFSKSTKPFPPPTQRQNRHPPSEIRCS